MAPLDNLIYLFPVAFKNGFYAAIPAVFNPSFHPQPKGRGLSVVAEENSLDPSFNDDPCPYLFHIDLAGMCPVGPLAFGVGSRPTGRQGALYKRKLAHPETPFLRACGFTIITGFV